MNKPYYGCWPTMITPFTDNNRIDFSAVKKMTDWYITNGCDGIFAVCQSSEMFFLSEQEKIDLAAAVKDASAGRVKVIASGHTADDTSKQIEELGRMAETGVDAVVLVNNRLAKQDEDETIFKNNFDNVLRQLPHVTFGMYECPYPYCRPLNAGFLKEAAKNEALVFVKAISSVCAIQKERLDAIAGSKLALFNANSASLLDSLIAGYDGYNGVMGNFHIDIYKWLYTHYKDELEIAREVSDFITMAAVLELRAYPVSAKYHFNKTGISMSLHTRTKDKSVLTEGACREIDSLINMENAMRKWRML